MELQQSPGFVIWLTGMKKAGKTTLATQLAQRLALVGRPVQLLDEDGEAKFLLEGLGGAKDDHAKVVKRFGYVARAVARSGGVAICAALSPYREAREVLRKDVRRFVEIFVDAKMETLLQRDGKEALYKRALASEIQGVSGVDLPYEPPVHADLVLPTDGEPVEACLTRIFQVLVDGKYVTAAEFGHLTGGMKPRRRSTSKAGKPTGGGAAMKPSRQGKATGGAKARPPARAKKAVRPAARKAAKKPAARTARR